MGSQIFHLFCPCHECPEYGKKDSIIWKCGTYTTVSDPIPRQRFLCPGGHTFSETRFSDLYGKHGSFKEYEQCCKMLKHGLHPEAVADVLDKDVRTILTWTEAIATKTEKFHLCMSIGLIISFLQLDELWNYIKNKRKKVWIFTSIDAQSKFWLNFELGSRTKNTANKLVGKIKSMLHLPIGKLIKFTTDKLSAYNHAIKKHFAGQCSYLQIVKKRYKMIMKTVKKHIVTGSTTDFPQGTQNTSYIERHNLTLRDRISYLKRKTIGYCKKKTHLKWLLWINLFDYNYITFHKSLRIKIAEKKFMVKTNIHQTPAMKIGITKSQLNWKFLITCPMW